MTLARALLVALAGLALAAEPAPAPPPAPSQAAPVSTAPISAEAAWLELGSLRVYEGDARRAWRPMAFDSWGSGFAGETWGPDLYFVGPRVIQVVSQGYHSGGILKFESPLDLRQAFAEKGWMLEMRINLVSPTGSAPAPFPTAGGEARAAARAPARPAADRPAGENVSLPIFPAMRFLRLQLQTPSGPMLAPRVSIDAPGTVTARGWVHVALPLADFKSIGNAVDGRVFAIEISCDRPQLFHIGQIRVTRDLQPLTVTLASEPSVARVGGQVRFRATVDKGLSRVRVRWDFDNRNGVTAQAEGTNVGNVFTQPGTYTVTAIVDDFVGFKPMVTQTVTVTVQ